MQQTILLYLIAVLSNIAGNHSEVSHAELCKGDIQHSLANPNKMNHQLGLKAETNIHQGLINLIEC
ncbi:MAG: UDP-glucose 4-epimerase [Paraglaciecola sp.]